MDLRKENVIITKKNHFITRIILYESGIGLGTRRDFN